MGNDATTMISQGDWINVKTLLEHGEQIRKVRHADRDTTGRYGPRLVLEFFSNDNYRGKKFTLNDTCIRAMVSGTGEKDWELWDGTTVRIFAVENEGNEQNPHMAMLEVYTGKAKKGKKGKKKKGKKGGSGLEDD